MGADTPEGQKLPAGHTIFVTGVGQNDPAVHGSHVLIVVAPTAMEYVPLLQGTLVSVEGQKLPAGHVTGDSDPRGQYVPNSLHVNVADIDPAWQ